MGNNSKKDRKEFSLPQTSAADLMGRQSVRATFRLSMQCIDAISILSSQLGIKQKSLFDHLMEDVESLVAIAQEADFDELNREERIQKTFVISKRSLSSLETISKKFGSSRDDLVEYSIQRLWPIIAKERQKQDKRQGLFLKITEHCNEAGVLLDEIQRVLGKEDPICRTMNALFETYKKAHATVESFIDKGKRIEDFQMNKFDKKDSDI